MPVADGHDSRVAEVARRQRGALSRAQAVSLGVGDAAIQRRVRAGRWLRAAPGVYVIAGAPSSWTLDLWVALLAAGPSAVVTHESALCLHGVADVPRRPLTYTVPHGGHPRVKGAFVHQIDDLRPHRVTRLGGLPVSTAERAVVEVAATMGPKRLGAIADDLVAARTTTYAKMAACLREVARPGKRGVAKLGRVLDERGDGHVAPESVLERALFAALSAGGLPPPQRQAPLPGRGAVDGRVDAAYSDARLLLEADGRRWHSRIRDLRRDRLRDTEAARAGWLTLRFGYEELIGSPADVCAAVAEVRAQRLARQ